MGIAEARASIVEPAAAGVVFEKEAPQELVDELRRVNAAGVRGQRVESLGLWLEPVQLQVVCHRLWSELPGDRKRITREDVRGKGNIDTALGEVYAGIVREVAESAGVPERLLRRWVERALISPQGVRMQVIRWDHPGIPPEVLERLESRHLVRGDVRRGETWYEVAHERLVAPILKNNDAWEASKLHAFQQQGRKWRRNRSPGLLLSGRPLEEAEAWAVANPGMINEEDQEYLSESREAVERVNNNWETGALERAVFFGVQAGFGILVVFYTKDLSTYSLVIFGVKATEILSFRAVNLYRGGANWISWKTQELMWIYLATVGAIAINCNFPEQGHVQTVEGNLLLAALAASVAGISSGRWFWYLVTMFLAELWGIVWAEEQPGFTDAWASTIFAGACIAALVVGAIVTAAELLQQNLRQWVGARK